MTTVALARTSAVTNNTQMQDIVTLIHTHLLAAGFTQRADTGQANPAAITTAGGYLMYDFGAGNPLVLKMEHSVAASAHQVHVTIGESSDGAGSIVDIVTARLLCTSQGGTGQATTPFTTRFSYDTDGSRFLASFHEQDSSSNRTWMFGFERTADGAAIFSIRGGLNFNTTNLNQVICGVIGEGSGPVHQLSIAHPGLDTLAHNGNTSLLPIQAWNGWHRHTFKGIRFIESADYTYATVITIDVDGVPTDFLIVDANYGYMLPSWDSGRPAIIWE